MKLTDLAPSYKGDLDPEIKGITHDSRRVEDGYLFAALPGSKDNGARYIEDAIHHGAVAVLVEPGTHVEKGRHDIAITVAENPRRELAHIAASFYAKQPPMIAAVTGTNGKTSTVHFTQQLWNALGEKAASLGTLGVRGAGMDKAGSLTTPDPIALHAELADLAAAGVTHLAMEASSHGLHQSRLDGVKAMAAGFTNLSHDHLDYHKTMEEYLIAKAHLFEDILQIGGVAVLNADIPEFKELTDRVTKRGCCVLSYGVNGEDIKLVSLDAMPAGQRMKLSVMGQEFVLMLPLVGVFQAMNALCALGLVMAEASENAERNAKLVPLLETLHGAPGRLEFVGGLPKGAVYVDYAHTPDALENVLKALRPHTPGRLLCLMGCGGNRDAAKRPVMGRIAGDLADMVIITDDNPRHEDPQAIREEIKSGVSEEAMAMVVPNRGEAILSSVAEMKEGDVLVIAGKGHEQGQIVGDKTLPFDDVEMARNAIEQSEGL